MKIALLTDSHFGAKKNNPIFLESQLRFYHEVFFPYLKKNNIKTIIHGGDFFDNRTNINVNILNEVDKLLIENFKDFDTYILVGNHDTYLRTTIDIHSLKPFRYIKHINVIENIEKVNFGGRDILMVPWQVDHDKFIKKVADKNFHTDVAIGHFEINGFNLNNSKVCDFGINPDLFFDNYTLTFSGHFHHRKLMERDGRKIQYIGNTQQMDRGDIGSPRGFCVLDTDTLEYEFIDNDVSIKFLKLKFPDFFDEKDIKGNIVDVIIDVAQDNDEKELQKYISEIESFNPAFPPEIKLENNVNTSSSGNYNIQSTEELIEEYIKDMEDVSDDKKNDLTKKLLKLYKECKTEI